ncbi:MAG: UDP-glucose 4-epimerase GalE, partial [Melioribacteraceae bacterium]|nr:UDP-glucose 4-epimerase GalE [Melioribacteraceae bacterium]
MQEKLSVLVTGGAGYIGSHCVKELCENGHNVTILDNFSTGLFENIDSRAIEVVKGDIMNNSDLRKAFKAKKDVVFHFAAWKAAGESMINPQKYAKNNICGTINLLNKMVESEVKYFVFSSSAAVYGNPIYLPMDEKHPTNPTNFYGYTKLVIEQNLEWYSKLKNIRYAALRYFNATGYDIEGKIKGKEKNAANLSPIVMEAASGIREKMQVYGNDYDTSDGTCIRDYIHVNDLASAHLLAMNYVYDSNDNLIINLGTGKGETVINVINTASEVVGKNIDYEIVGRREGDPEELVANSNLAHE